MKLDALLKKRADIERAIAAAEISEKRKQAIADLAEKIGVLSATDEEITAALKPLAARRSPATGAKSVPTAMPS